MVKAQLIHKKNLTALVLFFLLGVNSPRAEKSVATLDPVTVTAERFPVKEKESPRFVTVVSHEELSETGADNLADALRSIGGLAFNAYAPLGISRGGMSSTFRVRGIKDGELVLINGAPIQSAVGHGYDLSAIPIDQIERIEILKGAASTLYGADAMSGVINIITRKTRLKTAINGSMEFGSDYYHNHNITVSFRDINLGFNYQHLGGKAEISRSITSGYRYDLADTDKFAWNLNAGLIDDLFFDYLGSYYRTGAQKHYDDETIPYEGTDDEHSAHFASLRYQGSAFKVKAFGSRNEMLSRPYANQDASERKHTSYNYGLEGGYQLELSGWQFDVGADWVYRGADYHPNVGKHYRNDYAFFLQAKKTLWKWLTANAGVREQLVHGESGARNYNRLLPSFGLSCKAAEALIVFANVGKAFRVPTFNSLYYQNSNYFVGNPNLKPEEGWTYETGLKYDDDMFSLRLAAFLMAYEDKIELDRSKGYPLPYFNAGSYKSQGIEWDLEISPFIHLSGWMQGIYLYTAGYWADPSSEDTNGKRYQTGPKFQNSLGLKYLGETLILSLNYQLLATREGGLKDTSILNLSGKYRLWIGFVTLTVDNLFNQEVQLAGELSEDALSRYVYHGLGRFVKVGYAFGF